MKKNKLLIVLLCLQINVFAQENPQPKFTWNAYAELYYAYDFNKPTDHQRPAFLYSHNRSNEMNLNLGFVKGNFSSERFRATLAFAAGTYVNANYTAEPGVLKNVYEANMGVKLSKKENLWLDIGVMPSHIGFESAVSRDCWTLTRSIAAENSPYYESGLKLSYGTKNDQWKFSAFLLNGWQKITRVNGNDIPAFGTQITFVPTSKLTLNHSSFFGSDYPDSLHRYRIFQNFYGIWSLNDHIGLTLGFDYGMEKVNGNWESWYTPQAVIRYQVNSQWAAALRGEYYSDPKNLIITAYNNGFDVTGLSFNIDYSPFPFATMRIEGRGLMAGKPIFVKGDELKKNNLAITFSTAFYF